MINNLFIITFIFIIGTVFGSFLFCIAYRYINKISIIKGRSRCDYCGHELNAFDLIPIISFVINKGRCKYCGHKIDYSYLVSEIVTGICYLLLYIKCGLTIKFLMYVILTSILIVVSFIDYKTYTIPDVLVVLGVTNLFIFKGININILINGLLIGSFMFIIRFVMNHVLKARSSDSNNNESMGLGDIKLITMLGCYVSLYGSFIAILISCIVGIVFVIFMKKKTIPFGPSICIGYLITLLCVMVV
ncbi:MAG: prepilin peptidase [Erysipelotrichaceae bacterium]|nr:prepilin peptidase [Erysipelotrichaceae bacterium]